MSIVSHRNMIFNIWSFPAKRFGLSKPRQRDLYLQECLREDLAAIGANVLKGKYYKAMYMYVMFKSMN